MKGFLLKTFLGVCLLIEGYLVYKLLNVSNEIYNALYTGLTIVFLLSIIRTINYLTNNIYGNN